MCVFICTQCISIVQEEHLLSFDISSMDNLFNADYTSSSLGDYANIQNTTDSIQRNHYVSPSILARYIVFVSGVRPSVCPVLACPRGISKTIGWILMKLCRIDNYNA